MVTKVSTQGRITIPKKIRDRLGLKPGMVVEVLHILAKLDSDSG